MMRIVKVQTLVWIASSLIWLVFGFLSGLSAFLGGAAVVVPGLYMAWKLNRPVAEANKAFAFMINAEVGKLVLTGSLIVISFVLVPKVEISAFFLSLVLGLLCNALVPIYLTYVRRRAEK